jgi:hypothetical protein
MRRRLPTPPSALSAWIAKSIKNSKTGQVPVGAEEIYVPRTLISLLYELPAPPKVRAAAFRVLASLPNIKSLGAVKGGRGLLITSGKAAEEDKLVIDPRTSLVRNVTCASTETSKADITITVLTAERTNQLPKVTPTRPQPPGRG